jgi:hypothetical protein
MMSYPELLEEGPDIGTGVMEGAGKHAVAARLDGSGMQWSPPRAENVLTLRLVFVNDLWSAFRKNTPSNGTNNAANGPSQESPRRGH